MSQKQAKRLRKAAMGVAVAVTEAGKQIHERGLLAQEHQRMTNPGLAFSSDPEVAPRFKEPKYQVFAVTAYNRPDSLRGIVRNLKKGIRKGTLPALPTGPVPTPVVL